MPITSILATDAYKLSMAQAGFPLRPETFYFSFRRGGFQCIAFDLAAAVREMIAAIEPVASDLELARAHGYGFTDAMLAALSEVAPVEIVAVPEGTWVWEREPILTITGPSFLLSWLEPMLLWLNHPIQLATWFTESRALDPAIVTATCDEHAAIIERVAADVHVKLPEIVREDDAYRARVATQVRTLVDAAGGDASRIFEVGMRSAVCMQQHRLALSACAEVGVTRTSNLMLAKELGMTPVGTMGHEHVQRWGADLPAFRAMRDMRTGAPSYLLDTFDTMRSGTLAALDVMRERSHACSIRYDSGNKYIQYLHACELFHQAGLQPTHVLEDGLDVEMTRHFEQLRSFTSWPAEAQHYGYGGTIVSAPMTNSLSRDRVGAVYKLSETVGEPRMKFGDEAGAGKQSVPGRPVIWRRVRGDGPIGIIGQAGEPVPDNYVLLSGNPEARERLRLCNVLDFQHTRGVPEAQRVAAYSPATVALVRDLDRRIRS
jgi:nicotinate phosphoribosyltransferase